MEIKKKRKKKGRRKFFQSRDYPLKHAPGQKKKRRENKAPSNM